MSKRHRVGIYHFDRQAVKRQKRKKEGRRNERIVKKCREDFYLVEWHLGSFHQDHSHQRYPFWAEWKPCPAVVDHGSFSVHSRSSARRRRSRQSQGLCKPQSLCSLWETAECEYLHEGFLQEWKNNMIFQFHLMCGFLQGPIPIHICLHKVWGVVLVVKARKKIIHSNPTQNYTHTRILHTYKIREKICTRV